MNRKNLVFAFCLILGLSACGGASKYLRPDQVSQLIWSDDSLTLLERGDCPAGYKCLPDDREALKLAAQDQRLSIARRRGESTAVPGRLPYQLSKQEQDIVENAVRERLKDPYSARFHDMKASNSDGERMVIVCGYVNAKNAYGGYVGKRIYIATLKPAIDRGAPPAAVVKSVASDAGSGRRIDRTCLREGIALKNL